MKNPLKAGFLILAASAITIAPCPADNSLGTLSGTVVLQTALDILFNEQPLLKSIAYGFRNLDGRVDNALLNQPVISRIQTPYSVQDFSDDSQDITDTDVPCTLTARKKIQVQWTPDQYNATDRDLVREAAMPIMLGMRKYILAAATAQVTAAHYTQKVVVSSGTYDYDNTLRPLKKALDDAGVDENGRYFVPNSAVHDSLLGDSMIVAALNNPANGDAIRTGKLPQVMGLGISQYNQLANNDGTLVGFAGVPQALVYMARAPKNPESLSAGLKFPGIIGYVEEPVTGFRIMVVQYINPDTEVVVNRISWLEGYAVGNPANLVRLTTA